MRRLGNLGPKYRLGETAEMKCSRLAQALARAAFLAGAAAPLGACETINEAMIGPVPYVNESGTAPMRPGYMNLNGCPIGAHGVPFANGNGFVCRVNV
jgi:hypothetical protein